LEFLDKKTALANGWRPCEWKNIPSEHKKNVSKKQHFGKLGLSGFTALIVNAEKREYCCGTVISRKSSKEKKK
jgi:hypothetical protein